MSKPVFSGNLDQRPTPEVLAEVFRRGEDGLLRFRRGKTEKVIYFQRGAMVFASSNAPDDRLGELLIRRGLITYSAFEARLRSLEPGKRLGTLFVESGAISSRQLIEGVLGQVQEIIYSLFDWDEGSYGWEPGEVPAAEVITLQMSNQDLLLEGIRRVNRWSVIRSGVGELTTVLRRAEGAGSRLPRLSNPEREVLALLDQPRTVGEVCAASPLSNFETCRLLWGLKLVGLLTEAPAAVSKPVPSPEVAQGLTFEAVKAAEAAIRDEIAEELQVAGERAEAASGEAVEIAEEAPAGTPGRKRDRSGEQIARALDQELHAAEEVPATAHEQDRSERPTAPALVQEPRAAEKARGAAHRPDLGRAGEAMAPALDVELQIPVAAEAEKAVQPEPVSEIAAPAASQEAAASPPPASDRTTLVQQVEAFNEIHRFVYELLRYELGTGVTHFVARALSQVRAAEPELLAQASCGPGGSLSTDPLVGAGLRLGKTDLGPVLDALLEAELEAIRSLLGEKKAEIISQGVAELRKRQGLVRE